MVYLDIITVAVNMSNVYISRETIHIDHTAVILYYTIHHCHNIDALDSPEGIRLTSLQLTRQQ